MQCRMQCHTRRLAHGNEASAPSVCRKGLVDGRKDVPLVKKRRLLVPGSDLFQRLLVGEIRFVTRLLLAEPDDEDRLRTSELRRFDRAIRPSSGPCRRRIRRRSKRSLRTDGGGASSPRRRWHTYPRSRWAHGSSFGSDRASAEGGHRAREHAPSSAWGRSTWSIWSPLQAAQAVRVVQVVQVVQAARFLAGLRASATSRSLGTAGSARVELWRRAFA